jgi:hypothetical protein
MNKGHPPLRMRGPPFQRVSSGASQVLLLDAFLIGVLHLDVAARAGPVPLVQMLVPVQPLLAASASRPDVRATLHAAHSGTHALARAALHATHSLTHALAGTTHHAAAGLIATLHALHAATLHTTLHALHATLHATTLHAAATVLHAATLHTLHAAALHTATATAATATFCHHHTATQRGNQSGNHQHILAHDLLLSRERMN